MPDRRSKTGHNYPHKNSLAQFLLLFILKSIINLKLISMLNRAITFLVFATLAGIFGFFGVIVTGAIFAKALFFIFFFLFLSSFFVNKESRESVE
jgi:uncharacterized membrane protein YtjA (UPF0391 family)